MRRTVVVFSAVAALTAGHAAQPAQAEPAALVLVGGLTIDPADTRCGYDAAPAHGTFWAEGSHHGPLSGSGEYCTGGGVQCLVSDSMLLHLTGAADITLRWVRVGAHAYGTANVNGRETLFTAQVAVHQFGLCNEPVYVTVVVQVAQPL